MLVTQFMGCARTENFKHFRIYLEKSRLLLNPRRYVHERENFELKQNRFVVQKLSQPRVVASKFTPLLAIPAKF